MGSSRYIITTGADRGIARAIALIMIICGAYANSAAAADISESVTTGTAQTVSVALLDKQFDFAKDWKEFPVSSSATVGASSELAGMLLTNSSTQFKPVNAEHLQLIAGTMVVRATKHAIFISQQMGKDKAMVRVAPGATALVSIADWTVANIGKRCCGAVMLYLPVEKLTTDNGRINLLAGEVLSLTGSKALGLPGPERAPDRNDSDAPGENRLRTFQTTQGTITVATAKIDIEPIMKLLGIPAPTGSAH